MRKALILVSMMCIQSCGTVTTLSESDQRISGNLVKAGTYCESVSRVYSGVAYDLCKLNSKPRGTQIDVLVGFYLVDGILSVASDTVVLPYTVFQQSEKGSIQIGQ